MSKAEEAILSWPQESREAAKLVILQIWQAGRNWRHAADLAQPRSVEEDYPHNFPAPHIDAIESVIDYHVPTEKFTPLAEFEGTAQDPDHRVLSDAELENPAR